MGAAHLSICVKNLTIYKNIVKDWWKNTY